jgi:hypothetical protein
VNTSNVVLKVAVVPDERGENFFDLGDSAERFRG